MTMMLIDTSFLAHQAAQSHATLQSDNVLTGVVYGTFVRIVTMAARFRTSDFHFCFDCATEDGVRRAHFPGYKIKRTSNMTPEEKEERRMFHAQLELLRRSIDRIGWPCYSVNGYESDDIIACLSKRNAPGEEVVIVSSDGDLHQLLGNPLVSMYNPTRHTITREKDLPYRADEVVPMKAIGGCESDEVPGVPGVRATRALSYIRGEQNQLKKPKWVQEIEAAADTIIPRNRWLVKLPHPQFPAVDRRPPVLSWSEFEGVCQDLAFDSFMVDPYYSKWRDLLSGDFTSLGKQSTAPLGVVSQRRRPHHESTEGFGL